MKTVQPDIATETTIDPENPWLGLSSYSEETRAYFHGRDEEAAELARRVQRKLLTVLFGRDLLLLFVAIGAVSWLDIARIVRGQARGLRQREFVVAAEIAGLGAMQIMWRHIVPNLIGIVIVFLTLTIPTVILTEAFLSYLGLGAQAPLTSLGVMLADGAAQMRARPLLLVCPAVALVLLVWCCNRIGDWLRDRHGR